MSLSKRLSVIKHYIKGHYDHIWDTCCDHGQLGQTLIKPNDKTTIHFVDNVPSIINQLNKVLTKLHFGHNWRCHTISATNLPIDQFEGKHLIIIAGVGGDLTLELLKAISERYAKQHLEFIICPVHHNYMLRCALKKLTMSLISESLVYENKRFYEVLHLSNTKNTTSTISDIGEHIWRFDNANDKRIRINYLNKLIKHYKQVANHRSEYLAALNAYQEKYDELMGCSDKNKN